ncbi:MAG: hypothetical protein ACOYMA_06715 [Bacteroidia bacterium]
MQNIENIKQAIELTIDKFQKDYGVKCKNELATLAFFHLIFFDILKDKLKDLNIKIERKTIVSNHIDKSPIVEFIDADGNKKRSELGDLFFVFKGKENVKAILIQAKLKDKSYTQGSTRKEKFLYENWPEFEITKPILNSNEAWPSEYLLGRRDDEIRGIDSYSRFLTFNLKTTPLIIKNNIETNTFSDFFSSFIDINNSKLGHPFLDKYEIRNGKIFYILNDCLKERDTFFDWDTLCNWLLAYFDGRFFENKEVRGGGSKQIPTLLNFTANGSYLIENTVLNSFNSFRDNYEENENYDLRFFSLIEISFEDSGI